MTTETTDAANTTPGATQEPAFATATAAEPASQNATETLLTDAGQAATDTTAEPPAGAPESYSFAAPEGSTYDDEIISAYSEAAKALDLPQDKAQTMLDKMAPAIAARQAAQVAAMQAQWLEAAKTDKEFGGDKIGENLATAKRAMDEFATPELRSLLNDSGLGNHPEVIRLMYRAGKAISEDGFVGGRGNAAPAPTVAQRMYPGMNP